MRERARELCVSTLYNVIRVCMNRHFERKTPKHFGYTAAGDVGIVVVAVVCTVHTNSFCIYSIFFAVVQRNEKKKKK